MTIQNLLDWFSANQYTVLGYFAILLVSTIIVSLLVNANNIGRLKYVMSVLVYGVTVPGILAVMLILYTFFMLKTSLLEVSIVGYFAPVIAMVASLIILNKKVRMSQIPGFDRLSSLMIMISLAFFIAFVLQKTYFGILFFGSFTQLLIVFAVLFIIMKVAWKRLTK